MIAANQSRRADIRGRHDGFAFLELVVVMAVVTLLFSVVWPALARSAATGKTFQCLNNVRQLYSAWSQWAEDHNDTVVASATVSDSSRPNWLAGAINWNGANNSNYDPSVDLATGPLWKYAGMKPGLYKCPADPSAVVLSNAWNGLPAGTIVPRVRNISMNCAFANGEWLDKSFTSIQRTWRIYSQISGIVAPARTFLFIDEQPGSANDAQLNVACAGAQPDDPPSAAQIIDFPASFHNGAANLSFSDGHAVTHQWIGSTIRVPFQPGISLTLNVPSADSWIDVHWLAWNTTVQK